MGSDGVSSQVSTHYCFSGLVHVVWTCVCLFTLRDTEMRQSRQPEAAAAFSLITPAVWLIRRHRAPVHILELKPPRPLLLRSMRLWLPLRLQLVQMPVNINFSTCAARASL